MSATEVLRRMLDERRAEWDDMSVHLFTCTSWLDPDGESCTALEADNIPDGKLAVAALLTPEQVIAATMGTGTCHDEGDPTDFCCSECGVRMFTNTSDTYTMIASDGRTIIKHPNYCPNCGAKVVD